MTVGEMLQQTKHASREARDRSIAKALESLSSWDLYNATGFTSNINKICVDGLVNFALRSTTTTLPVRQAMRICCANGFVLFFDKVDEDTDEPVTVFEEIDHIQSTKWKIRWGKPDLVYEVVIRYEFYEDGPAPAAERYANEVAPLLNGADQSELTWVYYARYYWTGIADADGNMVRTPVVDERIFRKADEDKVMAEKREPTVLAKWPYRGIRWETGESVIEPIKKTILRIEQCVLNIADENDTHSRRTLYLSGVDEVMQDKKETNEVGHALLPGTESKAFYPDMHSEGMNQMFREWEMLMEEAREVVGVIRVKELHNASGPSRTFEVFPNLALAQVLQDKAKELVDMLNPGEVLHTGPLIDYTPQEMQVAIMVFRELRQEGAIDDEEYIKRARLINAFPERTDLTIKELPPPVNVQAPREGRA